MFIDDADYASLKRHSRVIIIISYVDKELLCKIVQVSNELLRFTGTNYNINDQQEITGLPNDKWFYVAKSY